MINKRLVKTTYVFWVAFFSFMLGQKSEVFSGKPWAWITVTGALVGLAIVTAQLLRDIWRPATP